MDRPRWTRVSSLWVGGQLSWLERLCLSSFAAKGYEVTLYSYDSLEVPRGVTSANAREVVPQASVFRNPQPSQSFAGFSNVFRYELMQKKPQEVWIDTDVLAGNSWLPDSEFLLGYESKRFVNGAVLRCPPNSSFLGALKTEASMIDKSTFKWGELGPKLITRKVAEYDLWRYVSQTSEFYPVSSLDVWRMFSPRHREQIIRLTQDSSAIHIWNEAFKLSKLNLRTLAPHPDSFLGHKLSEFDVNLSGLPLVSEPMLNSWARSSRVQKIRNIVGSLVLS